MGDGIKYWHEQEEEKEYKASLKRLQTWPLQNLLSELTEIRDDLEWLRKQDMAMTRGQHGTFNSAYDRVRALLSEYKS